MSDNASSILSQILVYPVKSIQGISLSTSWVEKQGVVFDRRFMIADTEGNMITARVYPQLVKVKASLVPGGMKLSYPDLPYLDLSVSDFTSDEVSTKVWNDEFVAYSTHKEADDWFSEILNKPVRLLYTGKESNRFREKLGHNVSFADGYPLLVISEASLNELNKRSFEHHEMARFRPNIVVSGDEPFVEDSWKRIRIGEVEFEIRKPCERCILTTVDPSSGKFSASKEPLRTLGQFRADSTGAVFFGQNMVALNEGTIQAGDRIEVLEYKEKEIYQDNSTESLRLTCVEIEEVARDFVTYWFEPTHGLLPNYLPGQHLPVEVVLNGESYVRYYSLSSSPSRMGRYAISVKRVDGGKVSNFLLDNMQVGEVLSTESPKGSFHLSSGSEHPLLLLSAGSGVTPMISMLRYLADHRQIDDVVFYHQCSTLDDIPFRDELDEMNEKYPGLQIIISLSQAHEEWDGVKGRLALSHLKHIPDLSLRQAFVCGPKPFMQKARNLLLRLGLPQSSYHEESFGTHVSEPAGAIQKVLIEIDGEQFEGDNQSPILLQAEKNGVFIANSCRAGLCGACMLDLEEGDVEQESVPALTEEDAANNKILACCCLPKSDIRLSR